MNEHPIGIFDSGMGGLSVWKAVKRFMPQESIHYRADQAHCPYGSQYQEDIIRYCQLTTEYLIDQKVKLIIVACNTATAAAIAKLRNTYNLPFVGMEPAIKPAAQLTQTGHIGVLATEGTLKGALYQQTKQKYANGVEVYVQVGYGLVEMVESGKEHSPECIKLLRQYLTPMLEKHVDQLVLGCTHYPFLSTSIRRIVGNRMNIIDPAPAIARQARHLLTHYHLDNKGLSSLAPIYTFSTSGDNTNYQKQIARHLPSTLNS